MYNWFYFYMYIYEYRAFLNQLHLSRSPAWSYASEPSLDLEFISELAIQDVMMYMVYNKPDPT